MNLKYVSAALAAAVTLSTATPAAALFIGDFQFTNSSRVEAESGPRASQRRAAIQRRTATDYSTAVRLGSASGASAHAAIMAKSRAARIEERRNTQMRSRGNARAGALVRIPTRSGQASARAAACYETHSHPTRLTACLYKATAGIKPTAKVVRPTIKPRLGVTASGSVQTQSGATTQE